LHVGDKSFKRVEIGIRLQFVVDVVLHARIFVPGKDLAKFTGVCHGAAALLLFIQCGDFDGDFGLEAKT